MKLRIYESGQKVLVADDGKTIATLDGAILGPEIWLGKYVSEGNYIEVDVPEETSDEVMLE